MKNIVIQLFLTNITANWGEPIKFTKFSILGIDICILAMLPFMGKKKWKALIAIIVGTIISLAYFYIIKFF